MSTVSKIRVDLDGLDLLSIASAPEGGGVRHSEALDTYNAHRSEIEQHLHHGGALLLRGFGIADAAALRDFANDTSNGLWRYIDGNSPRTSLGEGVYTASEYPPEVPISLHNELSYGASWPERIYFGCPLPATTGGVACMADSRLIFDLIPERVRDAFERHGGVRYTRVLAGEVGTGPTWQKTFESDDLDFVAGYCRRNGMTLEVLSDGFVRISSVRSAVITDPASKRSIWFNQAEQFHPSSLPKDVYAALHALYDGEEDMFPQNASYGNGQPIPIEDLEAIRAAMATATRTFAWKPNDVLVLNNALVAHGRLPFSGPRRLYVALTH